jgi:PAS domain S-box-containing protein
VSQPAVAPPALVQRTLLGDALDEMDVAAFVFDEDENYVAVNVAACRLTGYEREELLSLRVRDITSRPARALRHLDEVSRGDRAGGEATIRRKDGSTVAVSYRAAQTRVAGMPFLIGLCWPVDEPAATPAA